MPGPAVPRAPCKPRAGTAASSPAQPLGSPGRVAPWSGAGCPPQSGGANPGVGAAEPSPTGTSPCPAPSPLPGESLQALAPGRRDLWDRLVPTCAADSWDPLPARLEGWVAVPPRSPFLLHRHRLRSPQPTQLAPFLPPSVPLPERGQRQHRTGAPSPLLRTTELCPVPGDLGGAQQGGSPHCQLSPAPSHPPGVLVSGSVPVPVHHPGLGATTCPACCSSPLHPSTSETCPEAHCGTQISAPGLPAT